MVIHHCTRELRDGLRSSILALVFVTVPLAAAILIGGFLLEKSRWSWLDTDYHLAYFYDDAVVSSLSELSNTIKTTDGVSKMRIVEPARLRERLRISDDEYSKLTAASFPSLILIQLANPNMAEAIARLVQQRFPILINAVGPEELANIRGASLGISGGLLGFGLWLLLTAFMIWHRNLSSILALRKDKIEVLSLLGASPFRIRAPFYILAAAMVFLPVCVGLAAALALPESVKLALGLAPGSLIAVAFGIAVLSLLTSATFVRYGSKIH